MEDNKKDPLKDNITIEVPEEELKEPIGTEPKEEKHKKKKKESLEDKIEEISEELKDVKDKYFRALAEMDNTKKRLQEDLKRERTYSSYTLADKMVDSIEVFDQALNVQTDDPNFKNFLYGFKMIKDMFFNALSEEGVKLIETKIGDTFDPVTEHAVDKIHDPEIADNTIVKIVKKGYKFKDRLLRPAMVVINIIPKQENESDSSEEELQEEATA